MADSYLERVAGEIADLAIADEKASGDIRIVDEIAKVLGSSSQTLEEAFLTAVRVRKAEERARKLLEERKANNYADAPKPKPAPLQGITDEDEAEETEASAEATEAEAGSTDDGTDASSAEQVAMPTKEDTLDRLRKAGLGTPRRVDR